MYAEKITQQALDALNEYFTILSQTGYIEYNKVKGEHDARSIKENI